MYYQDISQSSWGKLVGGKKKMPPISTPCSTHKKTLVIAEKQQQVLDES